MEIGEKINSDADEIRIGKARMKGGELRKNCMSPLVFGLL